MKTRKVLLIVLVAVLVFALGACGQKSNDGDTADSSAGGPAVSSGLNVDYEAEGRQTLSEERVTLEKLKEVAKWANDMGDDKFSLTYDDFKAKLGVDANEYEWTGFNGAFFWYASDEEGPYLSPVFTDGDGVLFALGGLNVS